MNHRERFQQLLYFFRDAAIYLWYLARNHRAADYVSMGLGIRARYRRNSNAWRPHLEQSKRYLADALEVSRTSGHVAVLGAGRLYDFPLDYCTRSKRWQVDLYDYDPTLSFEWKRLRRSYGCIQDLYHIDLTGVIEQWTGALRQVEKHISAATFASQMREVLRRYPPQYAFSCHYQVIVSLNLLSQLGLYWRDRIEKILIERGIQFHNESEHEEYIEPELRAMVAALEAAHVRSIREASPQLAIIVSDRAYLYYTAESSHWQEVAALQQQPRLSGYAENDVQSWLWHIAPQGCEQSEYGEIHEVVAQSFVAAANDAAPVSAA